MAAATHYPVFATEYHASGGLRRGTARHGDFAIRMAVRISRKMSEPHTHFCNEIRPLLYLQQPLKAAGTRSEP